MKKIFFTLSIMLLSFTWTMQAQQEVKVRFGGEAGFNMSKWGGNYVDDLETTFKPGFHIGGVAEMMFNQRWSIQPEVVFFYEGTNSDILDKGISAMYIKFPLLVYYNFLNVGPGRLSPGVGPYCAAGIAGKIDGDYNTFDEIGRFDWGVSVKLAYELQHLKKGNGIFASLGFSQGFIDKTRSTELMLSVGYKFPYSKWLSSTYHKKDIQENKYTNE